MNISKLKDIHSQIVELRNKIEETDSKKESFELQTKLDALESSFEDAADEILDDIPDDINLNLIVEKSICYDISYLKEDMIEALLESDNIEDIDIDDKLKDLIIESICPADYIYDEDVDVEFEDD